MSATPTGKHAGKQRRQGISIIYRRTIVTYGSRSQSSFSKLNSFSSSSRKDFLKKQQ